MKKNFLFAALTVLLAGFWFGGASLADDLDCSDNAVANSGVIVCLNGTTGYDSLTGAINATNDNDTVTLLGDINSDVMVTVKTGIILNLNGHNLSFSSKFGFYFNGNINVTIEGSGSIVSSGSTIYSENCNLTINGGNIKSNYLGDENLYTLVLKNASGSINDGDFIAENKSSIRLTDDSSLTINGGTFNAKEEVISMKNGTLTINNGEFTSTNLGVIYVNANTLSANVIINGGKFTSSTSTDGFIAYGLTASNSGAVTINGGTFDITNGAGIIARGGNVTLGSGVNFVFNNTDPSRSGIPASPMYGVQIPVGYELVMDLAFNLKNPNPVINGVPLTTTNNKTGTLLIVGDETTQKNYVVSISGDAKPLTLTKATNDVSISTLTAEEGYQWYNVADENNKYVYNFAQAVTGNVTLESIINKYKVTFDANTGATTPYEEQEIAHGEKATEPTAPTSGDYAFSGWYLDDELFSFDTAITGDVTLTGKWGFAVTFDGADVAKQIVASGDKATKPSNPSKDCNSFDGWFVDSAFSTGFDFDNTLITGNTTIYAKWTYTCSRSSGGGGGSSRTTTTSKDDTKANTGDTAKTDEQKVDENKTEEETVNEENKVEEKAPMTEQEAIAKYGQEQIDAYKWALENGITTMDTVEKARLDQPLTRAELAKMMVVYIQKVLGKDPILTGTAKYDDVNDSLADLTGYIQLAYQYQIMGIDANGKPIQNFNPNGIVSRGEYATVFSRVLFGSLFNKEGNDFYADHIKALEAAGILTTTDPTIQEIRGWVMLMMYRSSKNGDKIAEVAETLGATPEESAAAEEAAIAEVATGDTAEAPAAEATTGDTAEVPAAEEGTAVVENQEAAVAEASTGDAAAEPSSN